MLGHILQCESELAAFFRYKVRLVCQIIIFSAQLYLVECAVRLMEQVGRSRCLRRINGIAERDVKRKLFILVVEVPRQKHELL